MISLTNTPHGVVPGSRQGRFRWLSANQAVSEEMSTA
jgi:hypothetical protein